MRIELIIMLIAGFLMANVYTDGKYMKLALSYKKYYQMAGIGFGALMLYWLIKKNPLQAREIVSASNEYIKYLPVDKNTTSFISPILDFTTKQNYAGNPNFYNNTRHPILPMQQNHGESKMMQSGRGSTKRSVSETKKKFVASSQNWKCGDCGNQLTAWFEVDHKIRLEYGGDNHINNLVALCRECHGKKTTIENL